MRKGLVFILGLVLIGCALPKQKALLSWDTEEYTYNQSMEMAAYGVKCFMNDNKASKIIDKIRTKLQLDSGLSGDLELVVLAAMVDEGVYSFEETLFLREEAEYIGIAATRCFEDEGLDLKPHIKKHYLVRKYESIPIGGDYFYNYKWCKDATLKKEVEICEKD